MVCLECGVSRRTAMDYLKTLTDSGAITIEQQLQQFFPDELIQKCQINLTPEEQEVFKKGIRERYLSREQT